MNLNEKKIFKFEGETLTLVEKTQKSPFETEGFMVWFVPVFSLQFP